MLFSTLFIACSNNETDEELQMYNDDWEMRADGDDGTEPDDPITEDENK